MPTTIKRQAAPEPNGRRTAWCRHCGEQIIRESGTGMPWYHIDNELGDCDLDY